MNPQYMGNHPGTEEQTHPDKQNFYIIALDTLYANMKLDIHHNNIFYTQEVLDFFAANDTVSKPEVLEPMIKTALGNKAADAYFEEVVQFTNIPSFPMDYLKAIYQEPTAASFPDNFDMSIGISKIDASYNTDSKSFAADEKGKPIGSYSWWPQSVLNTKQISNKYLLATAYPNPASNSLQVNYKLEKASNVEVTLINTTGKEYILKENQFMQAGAHSNTISIDQFDNGIYLLQVKTTNQSSNQKIFISK
jgi:hypothetical protein